MLKKIAPQISKRNVAPQSTPQDGFSLVELLIVIVVIGIIVSIAVPNLLASRRAANEASALSLMRTINSGETTYYYSYGNGNYGTLTNLYNAQIVDAVVGNAPFTKSHYVINVNVLTPVPGLPARYDATASPQTHTLVQPVMGTGTRDFGVNEAGVIHQTRDGAAVTFDPATRLATGTAIPVN